MGKKVGIAKGKKSGSVTRPPAVVRPKRPGKRRPHSITLADLFLWITFADECFVHPRKAFQRTAEKEGVVLGHVSKRVSAIEKHFGGLFEKTPRDGVLSNRGAALDVSLIPRHRFLPSQRSPCPPQRQVGSRLPRGFNKIVYQCLRNREGQTFHQGHGRAVRPLPQRQRHRL